LHAGYHNHELEWKLVDGQKPIELLAANTDKSIMLQIGCGHLSGNRAMTRSRGSRKIRDAFAPYIAKDWSPEKGYRVLFGDGVGPWKKLFAAAESEAGIEYYLIEQEGSEYSEMETAQRCLATYRKLQRLKSKSPTKFETQSNCKVLAGGIYVHRYCRPDSRPAPPPARFRASLV